MGSVFCVLFVKTVLIHRKIWGQLETLLSITIRKNNNNTCQIQNLNLILQVYEQNIFLQIIFQLITISPFAHTE